MKKQSEKPKSLKLSAIVAAPEKFQFRDSDFSERTVKGIVAQGIDLAKFDELPVLPIGDGKFCVGGDGHSRLEGIRRLAKAGKLPADWRAGKDWEIPVKLVTPEQAKRLSWTANLSRDHFTPSEEAKVYKSMVDDGMSIEEIAGMVHEDAGHVNRMLALNDLCQDIRLAIGKSAAAAGIDAFTGYVLASGFKKYGIQAQQQQQLWHCILKHAHLNFASAGRFIDRIGKRLGATTTDGMLFEIPANAVQVVQDAKEHWKKARSVKIALSQLMTARNEGALAELPGLSAWLSEHGQDAIEKMEQLAGADGDMLANLVAPPKFFQPVPESAADRRMARQYDPAATPMMM